MGLGDVFSDISSVSNPFGVPSNKEWNLLKGIYISSQGDVIQFFIETRKGEDKTAMTAIDQVTDSGGRRLAVYEYPYIDGQRVDDLGRKGETYTFNIKFFGHNYQQLFQKFEQTVINDKGSGTLVHPILSAIRGNLSVKFRDYEYVHRYDEWNSITIKAVFVEDNTGEIALRRLDPPSVDSALRSALQTLVDVQATVSNLIFEVGALLLLPSAIKASILNRLNSITGQISRLIGQISATFSPTSSTATISAQAGTLQTSVTNLSSGTNSTGKVLPPVFQVGFNDATLKKIVEQEDSFINANQVTVQQAVFKANQSRQEITLAISELEKYYSNDSYDMILNYRTLANSIQELVEVAITSSNKRVKTYTVPRTMSLRMIAKENGLNPDREQDIESLNPYLPSVNFIKVGSKLLVPIV